MAEVEGLVTEEYLSILSEYTVHCLNSPCLNSTDLLK